MLLRSANLDRSAAAGAIDSCGSRSQSRRSCLANTLAGKYGLRLTISDLHLPHMQTRLQQCVFHSAKVSVTHFYSRLSRTDGTENRPTTILGHLPNIENQHHPIPSF